MKARLFYFTSPEPGKYLVNIQPVGWEGLLQIEVTTDQLGNAVVDGAAFALREQRIPAESDDFSNVA